MLYANKFSRKKKGKPSGGIAVYYKNQLKRYISLVKRSRYGLMWIKIDKCLFSHDNNVYICNAYIPPYKSRSHHSERTKLFELLEADMIKYSQLGKIYITGDFNARTCNNVNDILIHDRYLQPDQPEQQNASRRVNNDHVLDVYGRRLLELCKSTGLVLANGRLGEDNGIGEFTFASHQGQSVVDYFLFNPDDRQFINNFVILPFEEYSDHAALNIKLQTKTTVKEKACHEHCNAEIRLCWDNAKREAFRSDIANTVESINDLTAHLDRTADSTEINIIVNNFVNELYQKALPHFGKPVNVNRNTKCCHKNGNKWFDNDCKKASKDFKSARNTYNRNKTLENRQRFTKLRTKYNKIKRKAINKYKTNEGKRVCILA